MKPESEIDEQDRIEPEKAEPKPKLYRTGLLTKRIPNRSLEAKMYVCTVLKFACLTCDIILTSARYARNSAESPLLRLPAEIRVMIWRYVLGGNTILMKFKLDEFKKLRLETNVSDRKAFMGMKGRFSCLTFEGHVDPFFEKSYRNYTKGFTLLNGVCRQLYKETALLPYQLNAWASMNNYVFWRYTVKKKRLLTLQRKAIMRYYGLEGYTCISKALFRFSGETKTLYCASLFGIREYKIRCGRNPAMTFIQYLPRWGGLPKHDMIQVRHHLDGSMTYLL